MLFVTSYLWPLDIYHEPSSGFSNNKGTDQPAHRYSLISAFVILILESIISRLATSEISIFLLVCVAEQAGLNLSLTEIPQTGFLTMRHIYGSIFSRFTIDDLVSERNYLISLELTVCYDSVSDCSYTGTILRNIKLPKPECNWETWYLDSSKFFSTL